MMFVPRAGDEQEHENDHETLLSGRENEETEEAFHWPA
jgi:hypothetical protein